MKIHLNSDQNEALDVIGGGINIDGKEVTTTIINTTYDELVSLRDSSKLIPGQQYRITDYVTTTSQKYTTSAEYPFDIIVTALDKNTLSEVAKAIQHSDDGDDYFADCNLSAWKIWYCLDNDTNRFVWAGDEKEEVVYTPCEMDTSECLITVPYEYDDSTGYYEFKNAVRAIGTIVGDPTSAGFYDDDKKELFTHWSYREEDNGTKQLTLHCRDIDGDLDGEYVIGDFGSIYHYKGIVTVDENEYSVWAEVDGSDEGYVGSGDTGNSDNEPIYLLTDKITQGKIKIFDETITTVNINPKGVIYRMIDEWNNDCPYDFKNIQFTRCINIDNYLATGSEFDGYTNDFCYTFNICEDGGVYVDASIDGNIGVYGDGSVYNNIIKPKWNYNDNSYIQQSLNDIVFLNISMYGFDDGWYGNTFGSDCFSNTFGSGCHSNTFGNYCHSNTFGNECHSNTFGNYYYSNIFGNYCSSNIFGNYCYSNTFGSDCFSNTFGYNFYSNTFGNECHSNTFGVGCSSNTFGNSCSSNIFENNCRENTFGVGCSSNTFGNSYFKNTFGSRCYDNTFGNECRLNRLGNDCYANRFGDYCVQKNCNDSYFENYIYMSRDSMLQSISMSVETGNISAAGTMTSAGFYQSSDERLKTFTSDYDINLDDIKSIKTGKFYWNSDESQIINGGVSAQTVEEYFPELVKEDETGMKSVNYDGLAVVAIAAIKKLTERIEQLEDIVRNK